MASCFATEVSYDAHSHIINEEKHIIFSGVVHYKTFLFSVVVAKLRIIYC